MADGDLRDFVSEAVVVLDADGVIERVAPFAAPRLGPASEQLAGARFDALFLDADRQLVADARRRIEPGTSTGFVARLAADDAWRVVDVRLHGPRDHSGRVVAVMRDASAMLDVGVAARLLRRITEMANTTSDPAEANAIGVEMLRATLGWPDADVVQVCEVEACRDDETAVAVRRAATTLMAVRVTQQSTSATVLAIPVVDDETAESVLVLHSAPGESLDERFLDIISEIGRQLGHVTARQTHLAELAKTSAELRRSNDELERFAYVASHDLQEPLRKVLGFALLLEQQYADRLDDKAKAYLGYMVDAAQRQKTLISDLLAYSRVGRRAVEIEVVDLERMFRNVEVDLSEAFEEAAATLVVQSLPAVSGSRQLLRELVMNLVSNAVKYRRPDQEPHIEVTARDVGDGLVEISVADDGIGIDEQYREQVFEVFRRLHSRTEYAGTGIGLAICRKIVEQHGGRIWIEASRAGGTDVRMTLPIAHEEDDHEERAD